MSLSASLIKKFVEATNDSGKDEVSKVVYGTVDIVDGTKVVVVDGSSSPTSITEGVEVFYGDRVLVTIENNSAVVTSNITHPATNTGTELNDEVSSGGETMTRLEWFNQGVLKADTVEADYGNFKKVYAETLAADEAKIGKLETDTIKADDISAESGKYNYLSSDKLDAKYATVSKLEADEADISTLKTDTIKTTDISAETGKYNYLSSDKLDAKYATVSKLEADEAEISTLKTDTIKTTDISAETGTYHYLSAGKLDATYADISLINVADGAIADAKIASLSANKLTAGTIDASKITVTNLNADNLTVGTINGKLIGSGTVDLASLSEEVPTKEYLDSVEDKLQDEIDGAIETFTSDMIPTLNNYPASDWTDDDTKAKHVGDICYVINESDTANGWCYRFAKSSDGPYSWVLIKDSDVTAALSRLQDAEGKITGLETFESNTTAWISDADDEFSALIDSDSKITTALGDKLDVSTFTEFKVTVDGISSHVDSLSTTVAGHTTTIQQHSTSIEQNANNIELKVAKAEFNGNEMISRINLDETTVRISADKLEVNGNLVVEDESENVLFEANVDNHLVTIGGWNVNDSAIYHGTDSATSTVEGLYLGTTHLRGYTDETHYFDLSNGILECSGITAMGKIIAESGKLGGWIIGNTTPSSELGVEDYTTTELEAFTISELEQLQTGSLKQYEKVNSIYYGDFGSENSFYLIPDTSKDKPTAYKTIGGRFGNDWSLTIGDALGVTYDGTLYSKDAHITGAIEATSLNVEQTVQFPVEFTDIDEETGDEYVSEIEYLDALFQLYFNKDDGLVIQAGYPDAGSSIIRNMYMSMGTYSGGDDDTNESKLTLHTEGAPISIERSGDGISLYDAGNGIVVASSDYLELYAPEMNISGQVTFDHTIHITGANGWICDDYGGGFYCSDTTWIRAHNNRSIYTGGSMQCGGSLTVQNKKIIYASGDTISSYVWAGAGHLTTSSTQVFITVPINRPIVANSVSISSASMITRQNNKYTHGSSASAAVTWTVTSATLNAGGIQLILTRSTTTNAVNNDAIGVYATFKGIKFS